MQHVLGGPTSTKVSTPIVSTCTLVWLLWPNQKHLFPVQWCFDRSWHQEGSGADQCHCHKFVGWKLDSPSTSQFIHLLPFSHPTAQVFSSITPLCTPPGIGLIWLAGSVWCTWLMSVTLSSSSWSMTDSWLHHCSQLTHDCIMSLWLTNDMALIMCNWLMVASPSLLCMHHMLCMIHACKIFFHSVRQPNFEAKCWDVQCTPMQCTCGWQRCTKRITPNVSACAPVWLLVLARLKTPFPGAVAFWQKHHHGECQPQSQKESVSICWWKCERNDRYETNSENQHCHTLLSFGLSLSLSHWYEHHFDRYYYMCCCGAGHIVRDTIF